MTQKHQTPSKTEETITQILVNVILRSLTEEKPPTGGEKA